MLHKYIVHNSFALSDTSPRSSSTSPRSSLALGRFTFASSLVRLSRLIQSFRFMPTIYIYDIYFRSYMTLPCLTMCTEISPVIARKRAPRTHTKAELWAFFRCTREFFWAEQNFPIACAFSVETFFHPIRPARDCLCVREIESGVRMCVLLWIYFVLVPSLRNIQFLSFIFFCIPSMEMPSQKAFKELIRIERLSSRQWAMKCVSCLRSVLAAKASDKRRCWTLSWRQMRHSACG